MSKDKTAAKPAGRSVGNSEDQFEREYDKNYRIPAAIRAGLKELEPNRWLKSLDFAKLIGVSSADLKAYAEEFKDHIVQIPGEKSYAWWGSKEKAEEWRKKLGTRPIA